MRDAVEAAGIPVVEVHLSNVHARERWRPRLVVAPASAGVVAGFGPASYDLGLRAAAEIVVHRGAHSAPPDLPDAEVPQTDGADSGPPDPPMPGNARRDHGR